VTYLIFMPLFLACYGYAMWFGGAPERVGAAIFYLGVTFSYLSFHRGVQNFRTLEDGVFIVDIITLVALVILATRAERFWPLWLAAMQVLGTAGHLVKMWDPIQMRLAYAFIIAVWSYPMMAFLAAGTWRHRKRIALLGTDRPWSSFRW
jgi:hypothetical protein